MVSCILPPEAEGERIAFEGDEIALPNLAQGSAVYAREPGADATAAIVSLAQDFESALADLERFD